MNYLYISDDIRVPSGVGHISSELVKGLAAKGHNLFHIAVSNMPINPPMLHKFEAGQEVLIVASNTYDDVELITKLIKDYSIDCLIVMNDPHKYMKLWLNTRAIRSLVPVVYYNVWDTNLLPHTKGKQHFNTSIYESCDALACISKQTENFCNQVVARLPDTARPLVTYVPHGLDQDTFKPLPETTVEAFKTTFGAKDFDFVVFFNSRNQGRKKAADLIYAFKKFTETLTPDQANRAALILHTELVSPLGTNLMDVVSSLAPDCNICIHPHTIGQAELNLFYNMADVTFNVSNAEGWGLSTTESLLAGTPISATATGGLNDQMHFLDDSGNPIKLDGTFTSNSSGKYKQCGEWAYPLWVTAREIIGSPDTPYLYNDITSHETIVEALQFWYTMPKEERKRRGLKGREFCLTNGLNSVAMVDGMEETITATVANYKKQPTFTLYTA